MSRDVVITPANGIIQFSNASINRAQIEFDNTSNNLIITSSNGDVVIGDVGRNVYIGDGTNSVDVIFEQNGAIRALDGKTITLGQANSFVNIAANIVGSVNITGNLTTNNLVVEGSIDSGASDYAGYRSDGTNIILKGDSLGRSAIFFQSEKDGVNINQPTDFGYIQFHAHGIGGTTGETNRLVIGVANDADDFLVLQSPYKNGVKISFLDATSGTGGTEHTVWHAGNHGAGSTLDADLLDGQQGSFYAPNSSLANYVIRTGSTNVTTFKINSTDGNFDVFQNVTSWTNSTNHPIIRWTYNDPYDDHLYFASGGNAAPNNQTAMILSENRGVLFGLGATNPSTNTFPLTNEWVSINDNIVRLNSTLQITNTTLVANLNADLLDGQQGTYYLDWTNVTNKPDPVVTVTLTGDVTGTASATLVDLASNTVTIATTIATNSVALGTDTTGNYVATITGTTNQVTVSGSGSETAAVTLSLPQDIHTAATPTFSRLTLSQTTGTAPLAVASTTRVANLNVTTSGTADTLTTARNINGVSFNGSQNINISNLIGTNGRTTLETTGVASSVNFLSINNANTGNTVNITTAGADANVNLSILTKGNGSIIIDTGTGAGDIELKPGASSLRLWDDNSSHYYRFLTGDRTANYDLTLPPASGTILVTHSTVNTAGYFYTGTTTPTGTTRLNYSGYFYPTFINLAGSGDTTTAATHYFVETGTDGFVRPKTLANARAEIGALTAGDLLVGPLRYNSNTATAGQFYGGTTNPTGTTRLNYGGNFHANNFFGNGSNLTALNATQLTSGTVPGDRGVTAGSASSSFIEYNGTTATAGQFYGGTTNPTGTTRLNYGGDFYANNFFGNGSNLTALNATQLTSGTVPDARFPATLPSASGANLTALNATQLTSGTIPGARGVTAGSASSSFIEYNGTTATAGQFYGGTTNPTGTTRLNYGGDFYANNFFATTDSTAVNFNSTSDERKKENIETINSSLDKIKQIRGVSFFWKNNKEKSIGVIAQEIEKIIPEVVSTDIEGFKTVKYGNMIGLLIEAIKEQQKQIDELRNGKS